MANVARENIMKRIKQALAKPVPVPFPASEGQDSVFNPSKKELEVEFAEKFTGLLGRFSYCENEIELVAQLNALIAKRQWTKIFSKETAWIDKLSNAGFSSDYYHDAVADSDVTRFSAMSVRFSKPVLPGQALTTHMWVDGSRVQFRTLVDDAVVLDRGVAEVKSA